MATCSAGAASVIRTAAEEGPQHDASWQRCRAAVDVGRSAASLNFALRSARQQRSQSIMHMHAHAVSWHFVYRAWVLTFLPHVVGDAADRRAKLTTCCLSCNRRSQLQSTLSPAGCRSTACPTPVTWTSEPATASILTTTAGDCIGTAGSPARKATAVDVAPPQGRDAACIR